MSRAYRPAGTAGILSVLLALAILAGCSSDEAAPVAAGPASNGICLAPSAVARTEIQDDSTILFVTKDGKRLRNDLRFPCPGLKLEGQFSYVPGGAPICSNQQTIQVTHIGTFCELGQFAQAPGN